MEDIVILPYPNLRNTKSVGVEFQVRTEKPLDEIHAILERIPGMKVKKHGRGNGNPEEPVSDGGHGFDAKFF